MATAVITNNQNAKVSKIYEVDYPKVQIIDINRHSTISSVLPFRVKFTSIQIESIASNFPAIPFQIIGYSNYIL